LPVPHIPQERGLPLQSFADALFPAVLDAKTDNFFCRLVFPQLGQGVPSHLLDRTSTSLSLSHERQ
jgi:hypothetical protein